MNSLPPATESLRTGRFLRELELAMPSPRFRSILPRGG